MLQDSLRKNKKTDYKNKNTQIIMNLLLNNINYLTFN